MPDKKKILVTYFFTFLGLANFAFSANYYLDSNGGSDANDGLSESSPWKTISKLNSQNLQPGDNIFFLRDRIWNEKLIISSSGIDSQPIIFDAYGSGMAPVIDARADISGYDVPANWSQYSDNVYSISYDTISYLPPLRLWLSGEEYMEAQSISQINSISRWYFDVVNAKLYVYSIGNPASYYTGIKKASGFDSAVSVNGADFIYIRNLDIRGGVVSLSINGSSNFTIENSSVGYGAGSGIRVQRKDWPPYINSASSGTIKNCIIDSGHRLYYTFNHTYPEDGIYLGDGANYWQVHDNIVKDWGHTGIYINQQTSGYTASYNRIYSNNISAPSEGWSRGFAVMGREGEAQYNEFYFNFVSSTTCGNELLGDHNSFYYNIINTVRNSPYVSWPTADAFNIGVWPPMVSHHNKLYNNVAYNCQEVGIRLKATYAPGDPQYYSGLDIHDNEIKNNLILNCGIYSSQDSGIGLKVENQTNIYANTFERNLVYNQSNIPGFSYRGAAMTAEQFNLSSSTGDIISSNFQADPQIVNAAGGDFRPRPISILIDSGANVNLSTDIAGKNVPQGPRPDIGAYEYSASQQEIIYATAARHIVFSANSGAVTLEIPANAQSSNFYLIFRPAPLSYPGEVDPAKINQADTALASNVIRLNDLTFEINAYNLSGQNIGNSFNTPFQIKVEYPDVDCDGIVDNIFPPLPAANLKLYTLNESASLWQELQLSQADTRLRLVTANASHLSVFALIGSPSVNLSEKTIAWPNPFYPGRTQYITFAPMPYASSLTIYTLSGEKVKTPCENVVSGICHWDGKNAGGRYVASGVYLALIKAGSKKQIIKIAILR